MTTLLHDLQKKKLVRCNLFLQSRCGLHCIWKIIHQRYFRTCSQLKFFVQTLSVLHAKIKVGHSIQNAACDYMDWFDMDTCIATKE